MSKLSFDALSQRAEQIASEELLNSINGGTENDCHDSNVDEDLKENREVERDGTYVDRPDYSKNPPK